MPEIPAQPAPVAHEPEAAKVESPPEEITEAQPTAAKEEIASEEPQPVFPLAADPVPAELAAPQPPPAVSVTIPAPQSGGIEVPCEIQGETVLIAQGDRRYRIRGLFANTSHQVLKVNVCVSRGDVVHVDALDMTLARQRTIATHNGC